MKLKHAIVAMASAGLLSAQAYASEMPADAAVLPAQPLAAFTDDDMAALFDNANQPMQLAALSEQEMRETEGAIIPVAILAGVAAKTAIATAAKVAVGTAAKVAVGTAARVAAGTAARAAIDAAAKYVAVNGGLGALGGATSYVSSLITSGQPLDVVHLARDAVGGAVGGLVGGKLGKPYAAIAGNFTGGLTKGFFNR